MVDGVDLLLLTVDTSSFQKKYNEKPNMCSGFWVFQFSSRGEEPSEPFRVGKDMTYSSALELAKIAAVHMRYTTVYVLGESKIRRCDPDSGIVVERC